jgi:hypothetical protein
MKGLHSDTHDSAQCIEHSLENHAMSPDTIFLLDQNGMNINIRRREKRGFEFVNLGK